MPLLFEPLTIRGVTLRNRIVVSPMCQYSSTDGFATDWHMVHLGSRAVGGAAMVITEATAVTADGRISPYDLGIWQEAHLEQLARIAAFIKAQGAVPAIQLAHAGRKASTKRPWEGGGAVAPADGGWQTVGPTDQPFSATYPATTALRVDQIAEITAAFAAATERAVRAGFEVIELHAAHGYLCHQFLSPLVNSRTDQYGGDLNNRARLTREVVSAIRAAMPESLPLMVRISATDWLADGWDVEQSIALTEQLMPLGVDAIDVSSGGAVPGAQIPIKPGYQVPLAAAIRRATGIVTTAVGLITEPEQAEATLAAGEADLIALARAELRDPYWPIHAAATLGYAIPWPPQYERARR